MRRYVLFILFFLVLFAVPPAGGERR